MPTPETFSDNRRDLDEPEEATCRTSGCNGTVTIRGFVKCLCDACIDRATLRNALMTERSAS